VSFPYERIRDTRELSSVASPRLSVEKLQAKFPPWSTAMTQDLASMTITQETEDEVMALFARLEELLPGLLTLAVGDRKTMSIMGPTSERYVRLNLDLANQNAGA
jgi:hypothetical protein